MEEAAKQALLRAKELRDDKNGWEVIKEEQNVKLEGKVFSGHSHKCYRVKGAIELAPSALLEFMWTFETEQWKKLTPETIEWQTLETINKNLQAVRSTIKLPWPLTPRELVMVKARFSEGDTQFLVFQSIEHDKAPETKDFVRATVYNSSWIMTQDGSRTALTRIVQVDPSGNVPASISNRRGAAVFELMGALSELVAKETTKSKK